MFTPMLASAYERHLQAKGIEIVFVSADQTEGDFNSYYAGMPWLSLSWADAQSVAPSLNSMFQVKGIPSLVVVCGKSANLVSTDGRALLGEDDGQGDAMLAALETMPAAPIIVKPIKPGESGDMEAGIQSGPRATKDGVAAASGAIAIDKSKPVTFIQVRFGDGRKQAQEFNEDTTVSTLFDFVQAAVGGGPGTPFTISSGFPPKPLEKSNTVTIKEAGLCKGMVTVK